MASSFLGVGRGSWAGAVTQGHSWESDPKRSLDRPGSCSSPGSSSHHGSPKKHLERTYPHPSAGTAGLWLPGSPAGSWQGVGREVGVRSWPRAQWGLHGSHAGGGARASGHRCHQPPPCVRHERQRDACTCARACSAQGPCSDHRGSHTQRLARRTQKNK